MSKLEPEEKKEVTVKDMFQKIKATSSTSSKHETPLSLDCEHQQKPIQNELLHKLPNAAADLGPDDCVTISSSCDSVTKESKPALIKSKKGRGKGSKSSGNIVTFFSKDTSDKILNKCNLSSMEVPTVEPNPASPQNDVLSILDERDEDSIIEHCKDSVLIDKWEAPLCCQVNENFETLTCPVCGVTQAHWDLNALNTHVDGCLSQKAIKEILHNDNEDKQVPRLLSASSLLNVDSEQHSNKRLRSERHASQQNEHRPRKIQRTVTSFFQNK